MILRFKMMFPRSNRKQSKKSISDFTGSSPVLIQEQRKHINQQHPTTPQLQEDHD